MTVSSVMSAMGSTSYASNSLTISLMSVGLAVMVLFVLTRVYTKACIAKKATWDDGKYNGSV